MGGSGFSLNVCGGQLDDLHTSEERLQADGCGACTAVEGALRVQAAAPSGSLLSKWDESCQLSKSARRPPQA